MVPPVSEKDSLSKKEQRVRMYMESEFPTSAGIRNYLSDLQLIQTRPWPLTIVVAFPEKLRARTASTKLAIIP